MKITGYKLRMVQVPREAGSTTSGDSIFTVIQVQTDEGIEGIGYAGFGSPAMGKALNAAIDTFGQAVIGSDPLRVEAINQRLLTLGGGGAPGGVVNQAAAGIDVALWDIKGKAAGQPLWKLLGGFRDRVPCYASGWLWRPYSLQQLDETARNLMKDGYRSMKFRLGAEPTATKELARVKTMRDAVGPDVDLMIDINQGWTIDQAINIGRHLVDYDIYWLEDPTNHADFAGHARIADALDTPVAAGEYHWGITPFRHMLEQRSIDIVMVDLMRVGGITGWMKVAHMAEAFNLPVVSHLAPEVLGHCVAAVPNGLTAEMMPWSLAMFKDPLHLEKGELVLPEAPGLGLELDEAALAKFAA